MIAGVVLPITEAMLRHRSWIRMHPFPGPSGQSSIGAPRESCSSITAQGSRSCQFSCIFTEAFRQEGVREVLDRKVQAGRPRCHRLVVRPFGWQPGLRPDPGLSNNIVLDGATVHSRR
jgi:hypothetical protein